MSMSDHSTEQMDSPTTPEVPSKWVPVTEPAHPGKVYIGNLPEDIDEEKVKSYCEPFGAIEDCFLKVFTPDSKHKPYAFITFAEPASAELCVQELDGAEKDGEVLVVREDRGKNVRKSPNRRRVQPAYGRQVFVGNLAFRTSWQDLKDYFRGDDENQFNVVRSEVFMVPNSFKSKGCGVVVFVSQQQAVAACEYFNGKTLQGRELVVKMDMPPEKRPGYVPNKKEEVVRPVN